MSSSCLPNYSYKPTFTPSSVSCVAPSYSEHRSRIIIGGQIFFRSKLQGPQVNLYEVEIVGSTFKVYYNGAVVETHSATLGPGGIAALRSSISSSIHIEMPTLHYDIYDTRVAENDSSLPLPAGGLIAFTKRPLVGGSGGPTDDAGLNLIRTGPSRTMYILQTTENVVGQSVDPPANLKVKQWNGFQWVTYSNYIQGSCPV